MRVHLLATLFLAVLVLVSSKGCKKHKHTGCRLLRGRCTCETLKACHNPFPYNSEKECIDDVKGMNDQCAGHPCQNGVCTQVKHHGRRGWYCECAGTGFYGKRCQHRCPAGKDPIPENYPTACVMTDEIFKDY